MSDQPKGPSESTLRNVFGMLPSLAKGVKEGKVRGKGKSSVVATPTKVCPICCRMFAYKRVMPGNEQPIERQNCDSCQGLLSDGYIAFTCGKLYAFAKTPKLADMAGTVVPLSAHVMEQLEAEFKIQIQTAEDGPPKSITT